MEPIEELAGEGEIELFDWEDHLYESWLEEKLEKEKGKPAETGL